MLNLDYANLLCLIQPYMVSGRTESRAFLHWFLENIYRLDVLEVEDIVCDGHGDKGIDGIYINESEECIDIFQSKISQNSTKRLGDAQLKEFIGSLKQLETTEGIDSLVSTTVNTQLKRLINEKRDYLTSFEYPIRGIFVTNIEKDFNAESLIEAVSSSVRLSVWDKALIAQMYVPSEKAIPSASEVSFDVFGFDYAEYNVSNVARVVIAPIAAPDLVKMDGIQNQQIFDLNVRKSLGNTKVNKDISKSISDPSEHTRFLLYHNGITIICSKVDTEEEGKIKIQGYAVVNGCQSLSCLYDSRNKVTQDLRILTRLIEIKPGSELIPKITHNSNNQNGIKARDFRSNSLIQVRIQKEIYQNYPQYFYQIKRGDDADQRIVIDNELAGKILIAFDSKEPWTVHQSYKIFDESHQKIFARPEVTGGRIVVLFELYREVENNLDDIKPELFGRYQMTKFFVLYLLAEALSSDEIGKKFCAKPENFYQNASQKTSLIKCIRPIMGDLIIDLNGELQESGGEEFDFKRTLKTQSLSRSLATKVITSHKKLIARERAESFSQL